MFEIQEKDLRNNQQVVSKKRVVDHGEVYTAHREVMAMVDLVEREADRIESKFLEPACGSGNFLAEIFNRKLTIVSSRYKKSQIEFERNLIIAVGSIYGIDILEDNAEQCRKKLFNTFLEKYKLLYKSKIKEECIASVQYILKKNIIWGDALSFKTVLEPHIPIIFSEWSPAHSGKIKRRDFSFYELLKPLQLRGEISDIGEEVYIPTPVKEYPLMNYFDLTNEQ